ncbi:MAG: hypothetical protein HS111_18060 [Kofleriaceae bacterium]|nr:hypothetical protein [Kofleriaceae bacterium]
MSHIGTIWRPELAAARERPRPPRRAPGVVVEADAGLSPPAQQRPRRLPQWRWPAGSACCSPRPRTRPPTSHVALRLGAGGGHSRTAGAWGTFDLGAVRYASDR